MHRNHTRIFLMEVGLAGSQNHKQADDSITMAHMGHLPAFTLKAM